MERQIQQEALYGGVVLYNYLLVQEREGVLHPGGPMSCVNSSRGKDVEVLAGDGETAVSFGEIAIVLSQM